MARRPSPARLGILRAMLSRGAPLIRGHRRWFVRGWFVPIFTADVEALSADRWIAPPPDAPTKGSHRLYVLTDVGRALAAAAAAKAEPPTPTEEIAA